MNDYLFDCVKKSLQAMVEGKTKTVTDPDNKKLLIEFIDISSAGIIMVENPKGKVTYANPKAISLLGNDLWKLFQNESSRSKILKYDGSLYEMQKNPLYRSLNNGETIEGEEVVFYNNNGNELFLLLNISPLVRSDGRVGAAMIVLCELTAGRESEEESRYKSFLLDQVNDAILVLDTSLRIKYWSRGAEKKYGWTSEEAVGENVSELLKPRYISTSREEVLSIAAELGEYEVETIQETRAGEEVYIHSVFQVVKDAEGKVTGYITDNRDITARYEAELALKESEKKFSIVFNDNPAPIFITSVDGRIIDANESFEILTGYSREELLDKNFNSSMFYSSPAERERLVKVALKEGKLHNLEFTGTGKNGVQKHLIASTDLITINKEKFFLSTMLDMTSIKEAENALRESEEKLKQAKLDLEGKVEERTAQLIGTLKKLDKESKRLNKVLDMIPAYVAVFTKDHDIAFYNKAYVKEFGPVGANEGQDLHETEIRCDDCRIERVFKSKKANHWEWNAPNGKIYEVTDFPFTDAEGNQQVLEMGIDITEKRNNEMFVLQKILETEETGKRKFASDLHDDLGPTLSATKLQLTLLDSELTTDSQRDILQFCDSLLSESIEKMRTIANSILPHILESYGLECAAETFLIKVTNDTPVKFHFKSNLDGFRFEKETELHLYRIITELITNTIRHSGADKINLDLTLKDSVFEMKYSDNGKGYIFDPNPSKLSGIGLQNIKNRVLLINGQLQPSVKDGKTVVRISLNM